jgi:phenylpropionate dioxygenase-like ring-hydroxylating dioxygenase large terminal subunit
MNWPPPGSLPATLQQLHQTYCQLTGQSLSWRFDRERLWFEFHRAGFTLADLVQVVRYLQKEIRHTRRNVGALKLSNLLQLDRFEEDLNISRVRLISPAPRPNTPTPPTSSYTPAQQERGRQRALQYLRQLKETLR